MTALSPDFTIPSPLEEIHLPLFEGRNIHLYVKRDDAIHPFLSGNKYRKYKYNLIHFKASGFKTLITFGGAFSNHLHATATVCHKMGIHCVGIVRGEDLDAENPTLQFCRSQGMQLFFVDRSEYRKKVGSDIIQQIISTFPSSFVLPEGGSNEFALEGVREIWDELKLQLPTNPDFIFCPVGTGATAAGILSAIPITTKLLAFAVLNNPSLEGDILQMSGVDSQKNLLFNLDYTFGGYAKTSPELFHFMREFEKTSNIQLDPIYNGKSLFGFFDLIQKGFFKPGSIIVWIHTGGLQGKTAMEYMSRKKLSH